MLHVSVYQSTCHPFKANCSNTGTQAEAVVWTSAEVCTAIISACLPTYRPIFDKGKRRKYAGYVYRPEKMSQSKRSMKTGKGTDTGSEDGLPLRNITVKTDISSRYECLASEAVR